MVRHIFKILELATAISTDQESRNEGPLSTPRAKEKIGLSRLELLDIRNLFFTLCADAGNPTKRWSQQSLLPFFLVIENLPECLRNKPENMILFCLVPGPKHAKYLDSYLKEFVVEVNDIFTAGITCFDSYKQEEFLLRVMVLRVIGDYPGLCQLLSLADHKSRAGCTSKTFYYFSFILYYTILYYTILYYDTV
jgi:hypothetical protein